MRSSAWVGCVVLLLCIFFSWHAVGSLGQAGTGGGPASAGDSNGDGNIDISDPVHTLNYLFTGGPPPALCQGGPEVLASNVGFDPSGTEFAGTSADALFREIDQRFRALSVESSSLTTRVTALEGAVDVELVDIPSGTFLMGSPNSERSRNPDETLHSVIISKAFKLGSTEITQAQFRTVMGWNPSVFAGCADCPVDSMTWYDAVEFCARLTERHRADGIIGPEDFYRLPTESEWEYACRAGTNTRFSFGDALDCDEAEAFCPTVTAFLWYRGNVPLSGAVGTRPVKQKQPNAWGLYDMHGNVSEWCHDSPGPYPAGEVTDPTGTSGGVLRIIRGGAWTDNLGPARSAYRQNFGAYDRRSFGQIGFRVVLELSDA